jgi:beta-lactamase superfamily II metal-dependent hydrolase
VTKRHESALQPILRQCLICCFVVVLGGNLVWAQVVGEVLPAWTPGILDIHQISTGRGNSALFIFPDGTTMLVDAGAQTSKNPRYVAPRPDDSRTPGEWIIRYIRQMLRHDSVPELSYFLLTHFHSDHMGQVSDASKVSKSGQFKLSLNGTRSKMACRSNAFSREGMTSLCWFEFPSNIRISRCATL